MKVDMTDELQWSISAMAGLSLVNFLEQNLDDKELAVVIEGWTQWANANIPPGCDVEGSIQETFNAYTANCIKAGGQLLTAQERIVEVFKANAKT